MPVKWCKTSYPGVRYYKHATRKHGVAYDRYFAIRYQVEGCRKEEGLGWASDGMSAEKASIELAKLKEAARLGFGPQRISEKREAERARREEESKRIEAERKAAITFKEYFDDTYYPEAKQNKKKGSYEAERYLFDIWVNPVIGNMSFNKIMPLNIRALKKKMTDAGKSPATIKYAYAVVSQVWNHARSDGLIGRDCPTKDKTVKLEKINNKRIKFLSHVEAEELLSGLKKVSTQLHDMALLSLHCGLRAGEVFNLTWGCVDFKQGAIFLKDTKTKTSRYAYMTDAVKEMLKRQIGLKRGLVFKDRKGNQIQSVSNSFVRVVNDLNLNQGVEDRRDKVVFHTLRHTFASWHVMSGTDLYVVKELMGHSTIKMTERYAHLQEGALRKSVKEFEASLDSPAKDDQVKVS